jgi:membrane-bound lytic murein transglycosylase A
MRMATVSLVLTPFVSLGACAAGIIPPAPTPTLVRVAPTAMSTAGRVEPPPALSPPRPAAVLLSGNARSAGVAAGPDIADLPISAEAAARALTAFRLSCPALQRRTDLSGLARGSDWAAACRAAASATDANAFFRTEFEAVRIGAGTAFATGYYEPVIAGARTRDAAHQVPVYGRPSDLVELDLGRFSAALAGRTLRGRMEGGTLVPYLDRAAIDDRGLAGRAQPIAWTADYIDFFVLQIQGSGQLRLPDGRMMRIGYASANGHDYTGIGALMRDRGLLAPGQASMQGIERYLRANPVEGMTIMRENKSYVFFREVVGAGPLGSLNVPVVGRASVAADPAYIPLGAPVWLDLDRAEADGLWIAQDTGGAIKGANRVDTFWGSDDEARRIAGGMTGRGTAFVLLPRGTLARLNTAGGDAARP